MHLRDSMHSVGAFMLEKLLNSDGGDYKGRTIPGDNGHVFEFVEYREKKVLTVLGDVNVKRAYYYDKENKAGICPKDKVLDIEGVSFSPGIRRIAGRAGAHGPQYLWNTTIKGKSYAKNLRLGPELKKCTDEIANHQSFLKLCEEIAAVNERICDLRPVSEISDKNELEELKKKLQRQFEKRYKKKLTG